MSPIAASHYTGEWREDTYEFVAAPSIAKPRRKSAVKRIANIRARFAQRQAKLRNDRLTKPLGPSMEEGKEVLVNAKAA